LHVGFDRASASLDNGVRPMPHILVVDDDALMLSLIAKALPEYHLTLARDGSEALHAAARQVALDLIITDYLMPEMTGDELLGRLRERRPRLKALVVSGHGDVLERELPDWWRTEAHLSKPFTLAALRAAVEQLVGPA
jgi:CheY-like chemotaxis protein